MPTTLKRSELLRLARAGAQARISELQAEIQNIYRSFPDLRGGAARRGRRGANAATASASGEAAPARRARRGRRGWTAAQRKEAAERMKKYWATRRAGKK